MSDKNYTAELVTYEKEFDRVLVHMPGMGYYLEFEEARKLRDSLSAILPNTFDVTTYQLSRIMPNLPTAKLGVYWPFLNGAMHRFEINTPLRAAAFLAQLAHESGELRWMEEIWGPTDAQKRYEGRKDLGNTEPGDGKRFKGRGPIQLTGRANYKKYGDLLGVNLIANPELAAKPEYAFQTAALYWKQNGCNELADVEDFKAITKRINGGYNGLIGRQAYYTAAKKALGLEAKA